ncbi:MAG: hypothetical protein IJY92_02080 [Alphaproteobacteria bacterium]|nr:hypothetical protein [Alphaproteobacteria bacterium]
MHKNHISTSLNDFLNEIEFKKNHPHTPVGLPSGLRIFDTYTNGFQKGDLILIGARPAMGKTAFAINIAYNISKYFFDLEKENQSIDKCILYFNLAETNLSLIPRFINLETEFSHWDRMKGIKDTKIEENVINSCLSLSKLPIYLSNKGNTIKEIKEEIQIVNSKQQIGCIIIDYLQLIEKDTDDYMSILNELKKIAIRMNVPIIVLSQLKRTLEYRKNKIPKWFDIVGYTQKNDPTDKIIFLYRKIYYLQNQLPQKHKYEPQNHFEQRYKEWENKCDKIRNKCKIIIAKNNLGPIGNIGVSFDFMRGIFRDAEE